MNKTPEEERLCKFNIFVCCDNFTDCRRCGWNPEVAEKRHKETLRKISLESNATK